MAIHNPPQYRYSLFRPWDKRALKFIKEIAHSKNYPQVLGTNDEKIQFLTMLIRTQKALHGWRKLLIDTLKQVKNDHAIDTKKLIEKYPPESVSKNTPAWVTYKEDKIVSNFIDKLATKKIDFLGTDQERAEFILRFILEQLTHDWEWSIMMIWEMLGKDTQISLEKLNQEMRNFDYLKLFA